MTLNELIEKLQGLVEDGDAKGDEEVLFAHQPNYPLQCGVGGPVVFSESDEEITQLESHLWFPIGEYFENWTEWGEGRDELRRLKRERVQFVYLHEVGLPDRNVSPYAPSGAFGE